MLDSYIVLFLFLDSSALDSHKILLREDSTQFVCPLLAKCTNLLLKIYVILFCKNPTSWTRKTVSTTVKSDHPEEIHFGIWTKKHFSWKKKRITTPATSVTPSCWTTWPVMTQGFWFGRRTNWLEAAGFRGYFPTRIAKQGGYPLDLVRCWFYYIAQTGANQMMLLVYKAPRFWDFHSVREPE